MSAYFILHYYPKFGVNILSHQGHIKLLKCVETFICKDIYIITKGFKILIKESWKNLLRVSQKYVS